MWSIRFDMRVPEFSPVPRAEYYRAALELSTYADQHGCASIGVSEHHQSEDGYLPDALTLAAGIAAVTDQARIVIMALILTLHDPLQAAERTAVVDLISGGRVVVLVGGGYVAREFEMFGLDVHDRGRIMDEKLPLYIKALSGEPFERGGKTVTVTPRSAQEPRPLVVLGGTAEAVARRAARFADGFNPIEENPALVVAYHDECARLGKEPGIVFGGGATPTLLFLADDVDAEWERLAPYLMHEANMYGSWAAAAGVNQHIFRPVDSLEELKALGAHRVLTPDECIELARAGKPMSFQPLAGGVTPDLAWQNVRTFVERVLPVISSESGVTT